MKLEVKDLRVSIDGKVILDGFSLVIGSGEVHALMGPNGSGKSTLSFVLMGHPRYKIEQGDILLDGKSILSLSPNERAKSGLFLSFQHPLELQGVSLSKLLFTEAKQKEPKLSIMDFKRRLDEACNLLNIDKSFIERDANVGFSGGEKKRAEVLQLLILKPTMAIFDELDSGLDVDSLRLLSQAIQSLRSKDFSALIITHYPRILEYVKPTFVHIISDKKIVASGTHELAADIERQGYAQVLIK